MGSGAHWHPFSDMSSLGSELVLQRGRGALVYDLDGREYIDATAGLWFCNLGHGRRELAEVAAHQMSELAAYSTFGHYSHVHAEPLAARVSELAPVDDGAVFFTTGGSEAVETAMKIVRRHWKAVGQPERELVIAREDAYHGMSAYGTSLAGIAPNATGYGTLVDGIVRVPRDDPEAVAEVLRRDAHRIAAFIGEPVIAAGGVHPPPDGYWTRIRELCDEHDVFVIADEVVNAFGRLGEWFGSARFGLRPDVLVTAKGITSGYQPLGAVVVSARVRAPFWDGRAGIFRHGYTYSGHPVACAVAIKNLDLIAEERLLDQARELEPFWVNQITALGDHPLVESARAIGLLGAVELDRRLVADDPTLPGQLVSELAARGVLTRALAGGAVQLSPPLVISHAQIEQLASALRASLNVVTKTREAELAGA
jgi:putrescine---pyruvate transaminase